MKALKTLVTAAALLASVAASAQTITNAQTRVARDDAFGEFVYDSLGATPKIQLKAAPKVDAKVTADKAEVAKQDAKQETAKAAERAEVARRADLAKY